MSTGIYGGDEVGAIVVDIGSHSIRGGFAGEDLPKADIPSYIGVCDKGLQSKYYIDTTHIKPPRPHMTVHKFTEAGIISDWDLLKRTVDFFYKHYAMCPSQQHPLIMSESVWNTVKERERLCEMAFEDFNVPAFYLAKDAVLSSFANGRSTSLIVDCGHHHTTATPVYDGLAVVNASSSSNLCSQMLMQQCHKFLSLQNIPIIPKYQVKSKECVRENCPAIWKTRKIQNHTNSTKNNNIKNNDDNNKNNDGDDNDGDDNDDDDYDDDGVTESYKRMCMEEAIEDFMQSVVQVSEGAIEEELEGLQGMDRVHYEFNHGFNRSFGVERFKLSECLFDSNYIRNIKATGSNNNNNTYNNSTDKSIGAVVKKCINKCDVDIRPSLYSNIVVVGGGSLLNGFVDRLNNQLSNIVPPSIKYKVTASAMQVERKFSAWIGASILASLGSFQQLWVSRQEYEEMGPYCVSIKCP